MFSPRELAFTNQWIEKYHFRKLLGSGGSAAVWLADETTPQRKVIRPVAIKVMVADLADRSSFQEVFTNFQADLQFLADLAPDNPIVQYYNSEIVDIFVGPDKVPYTVTSRPDDPQSELTPITAFLIVMEYADGGHLGTAYRDEVILRRDDHSHIDHFMDVCLALQAAHERNIIHRDIKPSNLMWFRKVNRVKVADFGIAKNLVDIQPATWHVVGTPAYMCPESFDGGAATPQRDIYALGCTFYEILTGTPPFRLDERHFDRSIGLFERYRLLHTESDRPDAIVAAPRTVSAGLSTLIKRMMHRDPAHRPTLKQVIGALHDEKRPTVELIAKVDGTPLPKDPTYLSAYYFNPAFKRDLLGESVFFVFMKLTIRTPHKYKVLFNLLRLAFGDSFSIAEIYGPYDFIIRVWSTRPSMIRFCNRVVSEVLDDNRQALKVMACEDVHYIGSRMHPLRNLNVPMAIAKIAEAQAEGRQQESAEDAVNWLVRHHVYIKRREFKVGRDRVRSFTLAGHVRNGSEADREAVFTLVARNLEKSELGKRNDVVAYRRAYAPVEGLSNEDSEFLISYCANSFNDIAAIPSLLVDDMASHGFMVSTQLATKRYYVDSDRHQQ